MGSQEEDASKACPFLPGICQERDETHQPAQNPGGGHNVAAQASSSHFGRAAT